MWKKTDDEAAASSLPATPSTPAPPRPSGSAPAASIGASILIKGDVEGTEDLALHGRLEGTLSLRKNHVLVGRDGKLKGDVYGRSIHVEGEVRGNLYGSQEVILRSSGRVHGNIVSPRVTLENGSRFKGSIDMEGAREEGAGESRPERGTVAKPTNSDRAAAAQAG